MADKILRQENDQFIYTDSVAFSGNIGFGFDTTISTEIPSGDLPLTVNINGVDGISMPAGDDNDRPDTTDINVPIIRYNTDISKKYFEGYFPEDDKWGEIGAGGGYFPDISIVSFTANRSVIEFGIIGLIYGITVSWDINRAPSSNVLTDPEHGLITLPTNATGAISDNYAVTNTTGAEVSKTWILNVTSDAYLGSSDSSNRSVYWVYPYYYGTSVMDYSSGGIEALTMNVSRRSTKVVGVDATNEFIYYAYPASYPDLTSIKDGNGFDVTESFTQTVANATGASGAAISYKIYKTDSVTTIDQDFRFSI